MNDTPAFTPASIVVQHSAPISADINGGVVLMSVERGKYYDLDPISSDIWRRLAHPIAVSALCAELAARYAGAPETIERDVLQLLRQFAEQRLIEVRAPETVSR